MTEPTRPAKRWLLNPNFQDDLFRGAARFYADFRPPYPAALFKHLLDRLGEVAEGRLLDLACGTGEIAIPLHDRFRSVVAIDLEPDMIEMGRRKAADIENIDWVVGRAEDLPASAGPFQLVTIGNAFHRLDRMAVGHRAHEWLSSEGGLAILGSSSVWSGREPWQGAAKDVIERWAKRPDGAPAMPTGADPAVRTHEQVLIDVGFTDVTEYEFPTPYQWSLDTFIGYVYSTSVAAALRVGETENFENELRQALLAMEPSGTFHETLAFYYILGRR